MADEEVILDVDASGAGAGVDQFLRAMRGLSTGLGTVLDRLSAPGALGRNDLFVKRGQEISEAFVRGAQAGLAGFPQFAGENFGTSVLRSIGISPSQSRQYREAVDQLNRLRSDMTRLGDPITTRRQFDQRQILGLPSTATLNEVGAAYSRFEKRITDAHNNLQRLQNLTKSPEGKLADGARWLTGSAKEGVAWSERAQKLSQRLGYELPAVPMTPSGAPSEIAARNILQGEYNRQMLAQREQIRLLEEQRDLLRQAPPPREVEKSALRAGQETARQEAVRALNTPPSAERRAEMGNAWPKQHFEEVAAAAGMTAAELRKANREYPDVAKAARAEADAREKAAQNLARTQSFRKFVDETETVNGLFPGLARTRNGPIDAIVALSKQREREELQEAKDQAREQERLQKAGQLQTRAEREYSQYNEKQAKDKFREQEAIQRAGMNQARMEREYREAMEKRTREQEREIREQAKPIGAASKNIGKGFAGADRYLSQRRDELMAWEGDENRAQMAAQRTQDAKDRKNRQLISAENAAYRQVAKEQEDVQKEGMFQVRARRLMEEDLEKRQRASEREQKRIEREEAERRRRSEGFRASFSRGFTGGEDNERPFGEMVGQTARISLFYGAAYRALSLMQQALEVAVAETIAFEESLTSLNVVTGRTRAENDQFAQSLGDIAIAAGFTPSQGVELGSRALGLYGVASADQETQERTAQLSAEVATRIARVSGGDLNATQTQLAGALRSLGWGVERAPEMEDAVSYISRQTGQDPNQLFGALANVATLGTQAGFSPQQLTALLAQVGTTTGQNPEATAGQFRQLLSQNAAVLAPKASEIVGVDLTGMNLEEIFSTVSQLTLSADQLNRFSSLFGKGGSQQVGTIVTQEFGEIDRLATGAQGAQGFGKEAFDEVMGSFGNKLREFGAVVADFGVTLIETGVVDWLGALVLGATELMRAGTEVLDFFNELPRPLRAVAFALGELYAASLLASRMGVAGTFGAIADRVSSTSAFGRAQIARGVQRRATMEGTPLGSNVTFGIPPWLRSPLGLDAQRRAEILSRPADYTGFQRLQARTRLSAVGLGAAGAGIGLGALAISEGVEIEQSADKLVDQARAAVASAAGLEELKDAAAVATRGLQELRAGGLAELTPGDVGGLVPAFLTDLLTGDEKADLERIEKRTQERIRLQEEAREAAIERDAKNTFASFSTEGIATGMEALADQGYTATQQLELLSRAMFDLSEASSDTVNAVALIPRSEFATIAGEMGAGGLDVLERTRDMFKITRDNAMYNPSSVPPFTQAKARVAIDRFDFLDDPEQTATIAENLNKAALESLKANTTNGVMDDVQRDKFLADMRSELRANLSNDQWESVLEDGQEAIFGAAMDAWVESVLEQRGGGVLSRVNLADYTRGIAGRAMAGAEEVSRWSGSQVEGNRFALENMRAERQKIIDLAMQEARADGRKGLTAEERREIEKLDKEIAVAERTVVDDRIAAIRSFAQFRTAFVLPSDTKTRLAIARQALADERREFEKTADYGSFDYSTGKYTPPSARTLEGIREYERREQEQALAERQDEVATTQARIMAQVRPGDAIGAAQANVASINAGMELLARESSEWWAAQGQLKQGRYAVSQAQVQAANANRLAGVDPRNTLGRISAEIQNARAEMSLLPANQRGALIDQVNQLNVQYAEAVVAQANAQDQANIAGNRSSIVRAQAAIIAAQRTLGTQLSGTEGYWSALAELRSAQSDLAEAERVQADTFRRLWSDITDPVEQARLDTQRAREQLAADQASGQGGDVLAQSMLDVKSAEAAEERAAFDQRLSDIQTAEDLGRITHSQYMNYLQSEHNRLSAISDRTRQQQEQLDRVDQLMKAAAEEMQGQFNIGEIDLPTIYEVRRAIGSGAPTQVSDYSNSNNTAYINGADTSAVIAWLQQNLGAGAQVVMAQSPRRA